MTTSSKRLESTSRETAQQTQQNQAFALWKTAKMREQTTPKLQAANATRTEETNTMHQQQQSFIDVLINALIWGNGIGLALIFASGIYALTDLPGAAVIRTWWL